MIKLAPIFFIASLIQTNAQSQPIIDLSNITSKSDANLHQAKVNLSAQNQVKPFKNSFNAITKDLTSQQIIINNNKTGIELIDFADNPLGRAGVLPGDIIVNVNGVDIVNNTQFQDLTNSLEKNRSVPLTIFRQGKSFEISVEPGVLYAPLNNESKRPPSPITTGISQFEFNNFQPTFLYSGKTIFANSSIEKAKNNAKAKVNSCPKRSKRRSSDDSNLFIKKHDLLQREIASSLEKYTSGKVEATAAINQLNEFVVKFNQIGSWGKESVIEACGPASQTESLGKSQNTSFILIEEYKYLLNKKMLFESNAAENKNEKEDLHPYMGNLSDFLGGKVWRVTHSTASFKGFPDAKLSVDCEIHLIKSEQVTICRSPDGDVDVLRELECTKSGANKLTCNSIVGFSSLKDKNLNQKSTVTYIRVLDTLTITENLTFQNENTPTKIVTIARLIKK